MRLNLSNDTREVTSTERGWILLCAMKVGEKGRVIQIEAEAPLQRRLQELGFVPDAEVSVLQINGSIFCQVASSRFGIDRALAALVRVAPL